MKNLLPIFLLLILLSGAFYSYYMFASFRPTSITSRGNVMGSTSKKQKLELPLPRDHRILSMDENDSRKVIIFESESSPQDIQDFYQVVLFGKGWKTEAQRQEGIFAVYEYKKDDGADVAITSSSQNATSTTLVTINIRYPTN